MQLFFYLEFLFLLLLISVLAFPRSSGLRNWILWFFLKLHITIHINQAQTVRATQGVARWSPSLKYSRVHASIEKCVTHFCNSAGESIFFSHSSLWDGDLQQQCHHAIILRQPRGMIRKLFVYSSSV
jgi:hypothetical protein